MVYTITLILHDRWYFLESQIDRPAAGVEIKLKGRRNGHNVSNAERGSRKGSGYCLEVDFLLVDIIDFTLESTGIHSIVSSFNINTSKFFFSGLILFCISLLS